MSAPKSIMRNCSRGLSLVEVVIASAILSIVALSGIQSFRVITHSLRSARSKTIAANLVQERMEVLKNMSYYQLLVTTETETNTDYTPNLVYDKVNYTKESITLWGLPTFHRGVHVAYATISSNVATAATSNTYDTGMKMVTVYLWWTADGNKKLITLKSLYTNPEASNLDSGFKGLVVGYGAAPLTGARISVVGNPEWSATADSDAVTNWTMGVTGGTYSLLFKANGYYDKIVSGQVCVRGSYTTLATQTLTQVATGTITGTLWVSSTPVVSMVVVSTTASNGDHVEFVELYNPTTYEWQVNSGVLQLWYDKNNAAPPPEAIDLTYVSTSIPPNGFYLIANQTSVTVGGVTKTADAYFNDPLFAAGPCVVGSNCMAENNDGAVALCHPTLCAGAGEPYDFVCWDNGDATPPVVCNVGHLIATIGEGEQFVRYATTNTIDHTLGPAYDTDSSSNNWRKTTPIAYGPRNKDDTRTPVTGRPARNALVTATDGYSSMVTAGASGVGTSADYSVFTLPGVATGTWKVTAILKDRYMTISTVAVTQNATTWIPSNTTGPSWPSSGHYNTRLNFGNTGGFVEGYVLDSVGTALSNILVEVNGSQVRSQSNGYFIIPVSTGSLTVNANFNSDDPTYVTDFYTTTITQDETEMCPPSPYFRLGTAGRITGYVTSGTAALPNIVVKAVRGVNTYQGVSTQTGYYWISVPVSGTAYTVSAVLDPIQSQTVAPDPHTVTVSASGSTVHVGTITVAGGAGTVTGTVRESGSPITTGVLIVASEAPFATIGNPPPLIYASSAPGQAYIYYTASSSADGTYSMSVRASSALNMRAYYSVINPKSGGLTQKTPQDRALVTVTAGGSTTGQDFSW